MATLAELREQRETLQQEHDEAKMWEGEYASQVASMELQLEDLDACIANCEESEDQDDCDDF